MRATIFISGVNGKVVGTCQQISLYQTKIF